MQFTPKTEKQINEDSLLPDGIYDFEVTFAADDVSKASQNEMIHLKLNVFDEDGKSRLIHDYIVASMEMKLRRAAYACGLGEKYEDGELHASDFEDCTGQVKVKKQADKTGQYPDKNVIADYIVEAVGAKAMPKPARQSIELDDEIPF